MRARSIKPIWAALAADRIDRRGARHCHGKHNGPGTRVCRPHRQTRGPVLLSVAVLAVALLCRPPQALAQAEGQPGVDILVDGRLTVKAPAGPGTARPGTAGQGPDRQGPDRQGPATQGTVPIAVSRDWSRPLPAISRAVVIVHGLTREAADYLDYAERAREEAGALARTTLLIAPQFLAEPDIAKFGLGDDMLRWHRNAWPRGSPATGPAPVSPFDVLDVILTALAERARFPGLTHVVLAGHSSGGQLIQRYAAVGRGQAALAARGIALRHVVANPSSWLWFGDDRPYPPALGTCPGYNRWRYGLRGAPPYVGDTADAEAQYEAQYMARDMVYLVGDADTDPNHRILDRSCSAMAQGENRFTRAMHFMFHLELRHPNQVFHRIVLARGAGHDAAKVFLSPCGLSALFERPGCAGLQ